MTPIRRPPNRSRRSYCSKYKIMNGPDLYNIGKTPEELQSAIRALRSDFDAHIHDGTSSRTFQTVLANTVAMQTFLIRKTSYTDTAVGVWMGIQNNLMKMKLGSSTSYLQWDGANLSIVSGSGGGITIDTSTALSGSSMKLQNDGISFIYNSVTQAFLYLGFGTAPYTSSYTDLAQGPTASGGVIFRFANTSSSTGYFAPGGTYTIDLGTASQYFNEINYKTLTDRGCLGWFDEGVELRDGRKVSDTEALLSIKKSTTERTIYNTEKLDYSSLPKVVYKPAPIAEVDVYEGGKLRWKKGEKMGQDGAETTSLISIMLGAIKELTLRVQALEAQPKKA